MSVFENEYHPFAACLMFKACGSSRTVQVNIREIRDSTAEYCALCCDKKYPDAAKMIRELKGI
jgi:hypothetical protein